MANVRTEVDDSQQADVEVVAQIVVLVHARRKGDYLAAADAHRELERLGVLVRFPRPRAAHLIGGGR